MKKTKLILFSFLSLALIGLFTFEIFAAVFINMTMNGQVEFYATDIGASVFCTYTHKMGGGSASGTSQYLFYQAITKQVKMESTNL